MSRPATDDRIVQEFHPGASTATPLNVAYRLGKLRGLGLLKGRWLDFGCADGAYTAAMVELGAESAVGIDTAAERIEAARAGLAHNQKLAFACSDGGTIPFPHDSFDGAFMNEVLEHVTDEQAALRELRRVIRPGGHLVVISPNRGFPFECHGAHIGRFQLRFPVPLLPWLPSRIGQRFMNARNYRPGEMRDLIARQGFEVQSVGFVWPVLDHYRWIPARLRPLYQRHISWFDATAGIRRLGLSVLVVARKPAQDNVAFQDQGGPIERR